MKHISKLTILLLALPLVSCTKETNDAALEETVINYASVAGTWQLTEWCGEMIGDGRYCYLVIERAADEETGNRTLTIYQNIDSSKSRCITSSYTLSEDEKGLVHMDGSYDFSGGIWNGSYLISSLTSEQMILLLDADRSDISVYVRCDAVPDGIVAGVKSF